ncbi:MAG: hypothetical protein KBG80_07840 [Breznakibacter sp.]|nr:hypothetical protein [Breznakibacter sp.]
MTDLALGLILKEMYDNAPKNEQVANIHLFGIKYADDIKREGFKATEIIRTSGLQKSYSVELSKGMKLSKYVKLK